MHVTEKESKLKETLARITCDLKVSYQSTHQSSFRFYERTTGSIHLVIQSTGVAEVMSSTVSPP